MIALAVATGCRVQSARVAAEPRPSLDTPSGAPAQWMVRTELYFGLGRSNGPDVSDAEFLAFVDDIVTPRFPDGLTIIQAIGQWRDADGASHREPSRVIVLLHSADANGEEKIEQIRRTYCERFAQESVMRVDTGQRVSF